MPTRRFHLFAPSADILKDWLGDLPTGVSPEPAKEPEESLLTLTVSEDEAAELFPMLEEKWGAFAYWDDGEDLAVRAVKRLDALRRRVTTAESCTGGLVASRLTDVPGCSRVFGAGFVTYSWDSKESFAGVSHALLEAVGAVSEPVAAAMASGAREKANAHVAVSVTGEAGPAAGESQPVGTVFIGLADSRRVWVEHLTLKPELSRRSIRAIAAGRALSLLRDYAEAFPGVMAGGRRHGESGENLHIPKATAGATLWSRVLPWRSTSRKQFVLRALSWLALLAVIVTGAVVSYRYWAAPGSNKNQQSRWSDLYHQDESSEKAQDYPKGYADQFRGLYEVNHDVRGWIHIPETAIDYPVMACRDGYYDTHSFQDQLSFYGQPYFRQEITDTEAPLITVTGKNTRDGQMFSDLLSYRRVAYLQEHATVEMNTVYRSSDWEIFGVLLADADAPEEFDLSPAPFADEAAKEDYIRQILRRSLVTANVAVTAADKLLLMETDASEEYGFSGARLVVAARMVTAGVPTETALTYRVNYNPVMPKAYTDRK